MPANYTFTWDAGSPPPLAFRQRSNTALQGLRIAATNSAYPLYAQFMEAEFGVGVWARTMAPCSILAIRATLIPALPHKGLEKWETIPGGC